MPKLLTVPQPSTEYVPHTRDHDTARGFLLYRGPSRLTGAPIIAVATQGRLCENRETGAMHTLWVMREDVSPLAAAYGAGRGADGAVCGDCPLGPGAAPEDVATKRHSECGAPSTEGTIRNCHTAPTGAYRPTHGASVGMEIPQPSRWVCGNTRPATLTAAIWDTPICGSGKAPVSIAQWQWRLVRLRRKPTTPAPSGGAHT